MKKQIKFFIALAVCIVSIYAFAGSVIPSFIINPANNTKEVQPKTSEAKKKSKDEMREDVVHQSKEMLDGAVVLMRRLAQVNNSCAITQSCNSSGSTSSELLKEIVADSSRCIQYSSSILTELASAIHLASAAAEGVLEESAVFKKAGRKELNDVLERLKSAALIMSEITYDLEPFIDAKSYKLDYKALEKNLTQHSKKIAAAIKECKGDACLKQL